MARRRPQQAPVPYLRKTFSFEASSPSGSLPSSLYIPKAIMVDWHSQKTLVANAGKSEIARLGLLALCGVSRGVQQVHACTLWALHVRCVHVSQGLSLIRCRWEFVSSLDFDWQFISGKRRFRWPLVRSHNI